MRTDFGEALRKRRRAKRWTQAALSGITGIGRGDISGFENSREPPNERMVLRLGLAFGDVFEFFELAGYGRQRAVMELEKYQAEQDEAPCDVDTIVEEALLKAGWDGGVVKALLILVEATRPSEGARTLRAVAEPRAAYEC